MLGLFVVLWSLYIQFFKCDAIMGQTIILISENQRDCFTNDTYRGRSLVSSAVYYEVAPQVVFHCVVVFLGVLTIDPKDKGKGILQESESVEKTKKKNDTRRTNSESIQMKKGSQVLLAVAILGKKKKQLAAERAKAIRNKPLTKTQLRRNLMMTYLKNMGGYKHSQLKGKSYEEILGLYERQQKRIQDFTPMDSEKEAQKPAKRLKRVAGSYATQKSPKKPKVMK
ncbi:hypothetical protein Tco_1132201 [Tanacetum coccineum]|uniref:Uncharacterized protein n=1 Tax=Tanacetum coccineum TaxID=301880 RepID=A0ABQ5JCM8_9ASTR